MNLETLLSNTIFYKNKYIRLILLKIYHFFIFSPLFWLKNGPKLIINGAPKTGTHLLTSILNEVPELVNTRYDVSMWKIDKNDNYHDHIQKWEPSKVKFAKELNKIMNGQFVLSHMPFHKHIYEVLEDKNIKMINITRDTNEVLQSKLNYIEKLDRHYAHKTLKKFKNKELKIEALKSGFVTEEGYVVNAHNDGYKAFKPWTLLNNEIVLNIKFNDLAGSKKGFSDEVRKESIKKILKFLNVPINNNIVNKIHLNAIKTKSFTLSDKVKQ